ncbi:rotamase-domain-containing protein [Tuber magnatum]|uniref:Peptidyl-prolyl cis-trans isomerase n=1 Tax=Tuber magnatum TaxID=42249 RepID=A0A317SKC5_9PEZI|nr:rotamase-domain-containing protein [Tuber magnatum]
MTSKTGLPEGWTVRFSNSKNLPYYFKETTGESQWELPFGTDGEKLKAYMANHTVPSGNNGQAGKIRCAHLLVKHEGSRRPSSWKEANITRTKEDAIGIIHGFEARIRDGSTSLADLAITESDCSSARKRGDLGFFGRGEMQKEFEDAAFALAPGEMSRAVETASGIHLIERLE